MTKSVLTTSQWFLGVTGKDGIIPDDATLVRLLTGIGCREIEVLGCGTAQALVPAEWADAVERTGFYTGSVSMGANEWTIDIDLA